MTAVTIVRAEPSENDEKYFAISLGKKVQSIGRTAGAALDALNVRLSATASGTLIIVQRQEPDAYFTEAQINRLRELMARSTSESGLTLEEEAERDALIEAEFLASAQRTEVLADTVGGRRREESVR